MVPITWYNLLYQSCSLHLSSNSFHGTIPTFVGSLTRLSLSGCTSLSLQSLQASYNQFTGPLSDEIQKFSSLKHLYLSHNQLYGSISEKLWELPMLEELDLYFNNLTLPSTYHLSGLFNVRYIDLSSCKLQQPRFPKWIQTLKNLTFLGISNTGISDV
ncbi:unnamed protein product [Lactuca saligna]|uniref:Non-specific serine/threonine protein kinase n=1 Tax=Lactuca saligna TaxID=75948 RepID=A0AA35ZCU8_LACSI|nr:unnamed protein product [Lactuca saligna]